MSNAILFGENVSDFTVQTDAVYVSEAAEPLESSWPLELMIDICRAIFVDI